MLAYVVQRIGAVAVAVTVAAQQVGGARTHCPVGVHTQPSSSSLTQKSRPSNEMTDYSMSTSESYRTN